MIKSAIDSFVRINISIVTLFIISTNSDSHIWFIRILGLLTIFWIFIPMIDELKEERKQKEVK